MKRWIETAEGIIRNNPDRIALKDGKRVLTYREMDQEAGKIRAWLQDKGIGKEDFILVTMTRGVEYYIAMLGTIRNGSAYVLLDKDYPPERIEYIRDDIKAKLVLDDDTYAEIQEKYEPLDGYTETDLHDAAFAVYTSGSTGNPKGVLHEYGTYENIRDSGFKEEEYSEGPYGIVVPFYFVVSIMIFGQMFNYFQPHYIIMPEVLRDYRRLTSLIHEEKMKRIYLPPSYLRIYKEPAPSLEIISSGSEPVTGVYYEGGSPEIRVIYALSESGYVVLTKRLDRNYDEALIGTPTLETSDVHLEDEEGNRVEGAGQGELCFLNGYMRGYINLPEKTKHVFRNGFFHTGDLCRRDADGQYYYLGRMDEMFKINGNRVEPVEIERRVKEATGLPTAFAKGFQENGRSYIALFFRRAEAEKLGLLKDDRLVFDHEPLEKILPSYMMPTYYIPLDDYPFSPNGKIARSAFSIPKEFLQQGEYVEPEGETERLLAETMAEVLEVERVGATDDFYLVGGDSVRAIEWIRCLAERGIDLSVKQLYSCRTPRMIAEFLESREEKNEEELKKEMEEALTRPAELLQMQSVWPGISERWPDSASGNLLNLYRLKEDVDIERFRQAVDRVFRHHPVLLTRFRKREDGKCIQEYAPELFTPTKVVQLSEAEFSEEQSRMNRPMDIYRDVLHQRKIYQTEKGNYFLLLFHHILTDGSGVRLITDHIAEVYREPEAELPPDEYYWILSEEEKEWNGGPGEETREYIKSLHDRMKKDSCDGTLKKDLPGPERSFCIDADFTSFEKREKNGTIFYMLATAMAMAKVNHSDHALILWGYHGRNDRYYQNSAGGFVKYLPFYLEMKRDAAPEDYFRQAEEQSRFTTAHGACFREWLIDRPTTESITFLYQKDIFSLGEIGALVESKVDMPVRFDQPFPILSMMITEMEDVPTVPYQMVYCPELYSGETMLRFRDAFREATGFLKGEQTYSGVEDQEK